MNIGKFWEEYEMALEARENGYEGRSRVCARRAAAHLIREYLLNTKIDPRQKNSYDLILLMQKESIAQEAANTLLLFSEQVDVFHNLPANIDLIKSLFDLANYLNIDISGRENQIG